MAPNKSPKPFLLPTMYLLFNCTFYHTLNNLFLCKQEQDNNQGIMASRAAVRIKSHCFT